MGELVFIGLGLHDEMGISLRGLEEIKTSDDVFIEIYTSLLPNFSIKNLGRMTKKRFNILSRSELEEDNGKNILRTAERGKTVFLVPGDPFVATTHMALRIEAKKRGIRTRIIHGVSIVSAIISLSGLHNYKFGKSVTIPFPENFSETPYKIIRQNKEFGLHTLCLLDINTEEKRYLSVQESLKFLLTIEQKRRKKIATLSTLVVGVGRAGSKNPTIKAGLIKEVLRYNFGEPPQTLIFPGKLHFMEIEALAIFAKAAKTLKKVIT